MVYNVGIVLEIYFDNLQSNDRLCFQVCTTRPCTQRTTTSIWTSAMCAARTSAPTVRSSTLLRQSKQAFLSSPSSWASFLRCTSCGLHSDNLQSWWGILLCVCHNGLDRWKITVLSQNILIGYLKRTQKVRNWPCG